ncbi:MAG TPA: HhH-GPD-type base excision DNA repair protein [Mycobacteriales bacterium]|nr:HhH-GPD-type base excision DNA repair protein [Mycobacteriales bacterium]
MTPAAPAICLAQEPEADALLTRDPLALLIGMVLDQQFPLERAFAGPWVLTQRLGHTPDAAELASYDPGALAAVFAKPPCIHRFPGSMAARVQQMCARVVEEYGGDAAAVWAGAGSGEELLSRLRALPGFGEQKARIFVALLGKQLGVRPPGWREAAGIYGEDGARRSVADIVGPDSLLEVRAYKQQMKAAAKQASAASPSSTASPRSAAKQAAAKPRSKRKP